MALPVSLFSPPVQTDGMHPLSHAPHPNAVEHGYQDIEWQGGAGRAIYLVYRVPTTGMATDAFSQYKQTLRDPETDIPWQEPTSLSFHSSKAREFYVACGQWAVVRKCSLVARYEEYIVYFTATMGSDMTLQHFEQIVSYIDKQISDRLAL